MADQSLSSLDADTSEANELVVATEHLGFVQSLIGSHTRILTSSPRLGLTRLAISSPEAARALRKVLKKERGARDRQRAFAAQRAAITPSGEGADLDPMAGISSALRAVAAARHGGWMPTLGRNRLVSFPDVPPLGITGETSYGIRARGGVGPAGETSYGGGGSPQPIVRKRWTPPVVRAHGPGAGVRIGVLDTGIAPHPWLAGSWRARPSDVLAPRTDRGLVAGHGTFVAGLVLSQAPGATLEVRKVLDDAGQGSAWDVAEAIVAAGQSGVAVLNLSFSCYTSDGQPPLVLARAVDRVDPSVVVVAAAGNHADLGQRSGPQSRRLAMLAGLPAWPAALDDVVAVGALDARDQTAAFSPERPWVDVATRGVDLRSTFPDVTGFALPHGAAGSWAEWSGTSFSTALVSGAIAAGVDPGRYSAADSYQDLLALAEREPAGGLSVPVGSPRRLGLHLNGWARGSERSRR